MRYLKHLYFLLILIIIFSCETAVDIDADFRERYVLTSLINCGSERQVVYLMKTYDDSEIGKNPDLSEIFIHSADIKIWYDYDVFEFTDTTLMGKDGELFNCYVADGLKPEGDNIVEIEALLPNNLLLSSETYIPKISKLRVEYSNAGKFFEDNPSHINIGWTNIGNYVYDPQLVVNYYAHDDTTKLLRQMNVPLDFVTNGSDTTFVYPKPANNPSLSINQKALDYALLEISGNDPIKSNYVIVNLELKLSVYDENLSGYYSSTHDFLDQFSISLDTKIYSNVNSGHGIFASYISKSLPIALDKEYISNFGYRHAK